jgi:hypothetical protein
VNIGGRFQRRGLRERSAMPWYPAALPILKELETLPNTAADYLLARFSMSIENAACAQQLRVYFAVFQVKLATLDAGSV